MMVVTDNRPDYEKHLKDIVPSGFFIWDEQVYRRIEDSMDADIRSRSDGVACVHQRSGDLCIIDRDAWVVPCECELTIVG